MIRIAFIIDTIETPTGGTEKQLLLLLQHLDRSKFEPYLCVLQTSEWLQKQFDGCELVEIGVNSFKNPSSVINIFKFITFLKQRKIEIVQTYFAEGNKVGVVSGILAGVKTIVSTRRNQGYWHNRLELFLLKILNKWVTCFLANSSNTKEWTTATEGIDPLRIEVIYNGLEIERYQRGEEDQRKAFKEKFGYSTDAVIVGIVANLRPVKDIDTFLHAAKIVHEQCPRVQFIIIGEGPEYIRLEKLSADLGVASAVRFLGKRLDIPELLAAMDIGVLSSKSESFSNSIVEYLAACLPVVCTDVGGAREAVEDGVNGYVVSPEDPTAMADGIMKIIESDAFSLMGQLGRNKAEALFSLAAIHDKYEKFYIEILP